MYKSETCQGMKSKQIMRFVPACCSQKANSCKTYKILTNLKISRRSFMGGLAASAAVLPLSNYSWAHSSRTAVPPEGKIDWGYPEGAIRLNANENPYGPSPNAIKAMEKGLSEGHRYTRATQLTKELASYHGVSTDMILAGCGSTEFLRIAPWAFLRDGYPGNQRRSGL
jgi:histidinol-phosphate aminotransferase